jgi:hypothetical protein
VFPRRQILPYDGTIDGIQRICRKGNTGDVIEDVVVADNGWAVVTSTRVIAVGLKKDISWEMEVDAVTAVTWNGAVVTIAGREKTVGFRCNDVGKAEELAIRIDSKRYAAIIERQTR